MDRDRPRELERRGYLTVRRLRDAALGPAAAGLARAGVPPWAVSVAGVAAAASTFALLPAHSGLALAALGGALLADLLDGAVARSAGRASRAGKLLDHACDAAAFAALILAAGVRGLAPIGAAAAAALASAAAVSAALAASALRHPEAFRADPRAGFWAHLPKLPSFLAYPALLAGGPDLLGAALLITAWGSAAVALAFLVGLQGGHRGGSAWESNPPSEPLPTRNNGFEDRGRHQPPSASGGILPRRARHGPPAGELQ